MKYLLLLLMVISLQSCFTTRYVSIEHELKRDFIGASVDDVEFEFGEPDEEYDLRNGYAYVYNYRGNTKNYRNQRASEYTRISFDNNDYVRNIQSTQTEKRRKFSGGNTAAAIVFFGIIAPSVVIGVAMAAAAEDDY